MAHDWEHERFLRLYTCVTRSKVFNHRSDGLFKFWIWLLCEAKDAVRAPGRERQITLDEQGVILTRGHVTINYAQAAKACRCSKSSIHRRLRILAREKQISMKCGTDFSVVTITNYPVCQPEWPDPERKRNAAGTQPERPIESENLRRGESSPPPPLLPGRRFDGDVGVVEALIRECQNYALTAKAVHLVSAQAFQPMARLLNERDHDDIIDVFAHFVETRERVVQITFQNFFRYYEDHERHTIKAMSEAKYETFTERQRHKGSNGNGNTK